jgi:hypothetical protein
VPTKNTFNKTALRVEGPIFDRNLGRLEFGYVILEKEIADQWLIRFPDKIKEVTPQEVAAVYGKNNGTN